MYDLLKSLQRIITKKVVNIQTIREDISAGDTIIPVTSAKRFERCAELAIYRVDENGNPIKDDDGNEAEQKQIKHIHDYQTIELHEGIDENYTADECRIQNLVCGQWMRNIHLGDPPVIGRYPCVTIAGTTRNSEWLTLDSTSERHEVDISCYIQAAMYDKMYEYILKLTKLIETTLFYNFYPLVSPYCSTVLVEDVSPTDTIIRVADDDLNRAFLWFFLESDKYTRNVSPKEYRDNGVIELRFPAGVSFSAGDEVIFPGRHFYDTRAQNTNYGNVAKESLLYGSRISFFATEEVLRPSPFFEPLDRQ